MVFISEPLAVVEIRPDSHTEWSRQWMMKKQAISELQSVASLLSPEQRATVDLSGILDVFRYKLMVALMVDERKLEAGEIAASISDVQQGRKARMLLAVGAFMPRTLLARLLRLGWLARQNRSFDWHARSLALQADFAAVQPGTRDRA